ncbi:DNA repair protein RecN [bacterium]|nr:DNA repair protein RecN [bacterium]
MLKSLYIENYALIEKLQIQFGKGLNVITGETGTGKSIILGALGLILGDRAKSDMIRQDADRAVVEAVIAVSVYPDMDILQDTGDELIIRREVYANGRSRCFVNDSPVQLNVLSDLGNYLIDLHGQHEHQSLFKIENHLQYLDNYGGYQDLLIQVKDLFALYQDCDRALDAMKNQETLIHSKEELLRFQVSEIEKINPKTGEDTALESEERILRNAEKLHETVQLIQDLVYDGEGSVIERLSRAAQVLTQQNMIDKKFEKWAEDCDSARILAQEMVHGLQNFVSQNDFNPEHLQEIRERLNALSFLKKKYGTTLDEVLKFLSESQEALARITGLDDQIRQKEQELQDIREKLSQSCIQLSNERRGITPKLNAELIQILRDLGLSHAEIEIRITQKEHTKGPVTWEGKKLSVTEKGFDQAEFLISLNPGEQPRPLRQIASGGEISRIMLAIKTVMAESDNIPILVFDEIDTGISGRVARVVGKNLRAVSQKHQIVCITHLPQIASMADAHYAVLKITEQGRTRTQVRRLGDDDRIIEIAKLLGGETVTETAIQSARELLQ